MAELFLSGIYWFSFQKLKEIIPAEYEHKTELLQSGQKLFM